MQSTTAAAKGKYARVVDTDAGRCFLLVQWRDGAALEQQGFDAVLFHARSMRTFVGKGIRHPQRFLFPELWMPLAERALAQGLDSARAGLSFQFDVNTGELRWTWPPGAAGSGLAVAGLEQRVSLTPLPPEQPATGVTLEGMLGVVFDNFYLLHHACCQLDRQLGLKAAELTASSQELQKSHEAHQAEMEDMYVKVSLALNAKTDKLLELRERLQAAEARVKALQEQLAEAEQVHTDPEDEGGRASDGEHAEPQPTQQPPPQARAAPLDPRAAATAAVGQVHGAAGGVGAVPAPVPPGRPAAGGACPMDVDVRASHTMATGASGAAEAGDSDDDEGLGLRGGRTVPAAASGREGAAGAVAAAAAELSGAGAGGLPPHTLQYASLGATQVDEDLMLAETQPAARGPLLPPPAADLVQLKEPAMLQQQFPTSTAGPEVPAPAQAPAAGPAMPVQAQEAAAVVALGRPAPATWGLGLRGGDDEDDSDDDMALGLRK